MGEGWPVTASVPEIPEKPSIWSKERFSSISTKTCWIGGVLIRVSSSFQMRRGEPGPVDVAESRTPVPTPACTHSLTLRTPAHRYTLTSARVALLQYFVGYAKNVFWLILNAWSPST